jgi:hypothetical protein
VNRLDLFISSAMLDIALHVWRTPRLCRRAVMRHVHRAINDAEEMEQRIRWWLIERANSIRGCECIATDAARCGGGDDSPCVCRCHGGAA